MIKVIFCQLLQLFFNHFQFWKFTRIKINTHIALRAELTRITHGRLSNFHIKEVHTKCSYSPLNITPQLVDNRNLKKTKQRFYLNLKPFLNDEVWYLDLLLWQSSKF